MRTLSLMTLLSVMCVAFVFVLGYQEASAVVDSG